MSARRNRSAGFTLVEMLVALALVALMSVAMLQAYRFSQRALAQTTRLDAASRDIATAQRLLRRLVEQAYPFETAATPQGMAAPRAFEGAADRMTLSAPASAHLGGAGLYRYSLARSENGRLEVTWTLDRNGAVAGGAPASSETLLDEVTAISIAYLELIESSDGRTETHWQESWVGKNSLPAAVRIRLEFPPQDRRRWPELVVSPRLSADANCVFDVVSQMCRMGS